MQSVQKAYRYEVQGPPLPEGRREPVRLQRNDDVLNGT
jgi:hypothetical protein